MVLLVNIHKSSMDRLGDAHVFEVHECQIIWAIKHNYSVCVCVSPGDTSQSLNLQQSDLRSRRSWF